MGKVLSKKNAILVDFEKKEKWTFQEALETATNMKWNIEGFQSNQNHGSVIQNLIRYGKYFLYPLIVFFRRKQYANILAWQQFYGLILVFYFRIFGVKDVPTVSVMTFIYKEKKSILGKVYHWFVNFALQSGYIQSVFVYSESEKRYYSEIFNLPDTLFVSVDLGVEDRYDEFCDDIHKGDYYVSAGRSNRDYDFLINAWSVQQVPLRIICDSVVPEKNTNILFLTDCFGDDYFRQLAGARAVIIPVQDENISSGQLVALHAMMLGKPLIVTQNVALEQYVEDVAGFVIDKRNSDLSEALRKLDKQYDCISRCARKTFKEKYSLEQMGKTIGKVLKNMI